MLCQNNLFFGKFIIFCIYVLDIYVSRNGNNLKMKVKSELLKYGLNADKP